MSVATKKKPAANVVPVRRLKPNRIPKAWREILLRVPGYDSIKTAGDAVFCPQAAQAALDFFPEMLTHTEGILAGKPFHLEPWQEAIVANIFGWQQKNDHGAWVRRFRDVFVLVARKSGKSPMAAGIALVAFFLDSMRGKQCYLAAADRSQAAIVFRHCKGMVESNPILKEMCRIYGGTGSEYQTRSIVREGEGSFLRVISADANTKHGGITHLAIIDELHAQPNRDLVDVIATSMSSENVPQPLMIFLTTADFERTSICNEKHDYARRVRDGFIDNPRFLPVVYEVLPDEDWTDPVVWAKANPNLGVSKSREYMRNACKEAQEVPAFENTFKRLDLNIRTQQETKAIPMDQWDACAAGVDDPLAWRLATLEAMRGRKCAGGLDIGSVSDLTALVLLFGDTHNGFDLVPWFWCPRDRAEQRERKQQVPYLVWGRKGFVTLTEGNETDYQQVARDIVALSRTYGIGEIAADRLFQGAQLCQDLIRDGLTVTEMGQGYVSQAAPTRSLLELVSAGKLRHGGNPVMRWMASNAACEADRKSAGTILKFSKEKSSEKIDGIAATCNAMSVACLFQPSSVYATRGAIDIGSDSGTEYNSDNSTGDYDQDY